MKQSFLDSLKGVEQKTAEKLVKDNGHESITVANGGAIIAIVFVNTVVLWLDANKKVKWATAGDSAEVE